MYQATKKRNNINQKIQNYYEKILTLITLLTHGVGQMWAM